MKTAVKTGQGFTLIEVLVAMLVLSIGLLGVAGMQVLSLQMNMSANQSSQATFMSYDIIDRMRANRAAALDGDYDKSLDCSAPTGTTVAEQDLRSWMERLCGKEQNGETAPAILPQKSGSTGAEISTSSDGIVTVKLVWYDERWEEEADDGSGPLRTLTVQAEL